MCVGGGDSQNTTMIVQEIGGMKYALRKSPPPASCVANTATILATTIMLPLWSIWAIVMATPWKESLLSMLIPRVMDVVAEEFKTERQTLLRDVQGKVLDVGSGGGAYLDYVCQGASDEVVALEPIHQLHQKIQKRGKHIDKLRIVCSLDELVATDAAESFDWVILGNVLCEVPNVPETLAQVDRLLKPGGKVYFSEHVAKPKGTWKRQFQDFFNPCWRHMGGGCNCNRDSLLEIQKRNWNVVSWTYDHVQVCMGSFVLGLAQKRKSIE